MRQNNQCAEVDSFSVCSSRPFSLDETRLDKSAPATWLNRLSYEGKAAAVGKGEHTGAGWSLVSVIGAW